MYLTVIIKRIIISWVFFTNTLVGRIVFVIEDLFESTGLSFSEEPDNLKEIKLVLYVDKSPDLSVNYEKIKSSFF